ncbi:Protein CBR-UBC-6 [Caenorhabditis briggsae]|uniref:UBC core domain-containing protein n=2 Tax=Caenorhabditis briggsae TaxID=6238 RepID=A0AAE9DIW4_CAEBR|nr:Protein CBR-UBC-6 [Caenorhabditis briggsae]ULU05280.1 hypothetical protein L3Y34_017768 [Caenorhabditis briggsae]UMM17259.1 hypothetical protein L5515_013904 [Caenorhabditis briggsae]CAP31914.1 Protein CBR-UBC-6 [Caenorhabditis briggsae]
MTQQYNTKSAGVRRLMQEAKELRQPTEMYFAQPIEDNLFEWHFTIRGTIGTDFEGGIYHGRIMFPAEYPMKPPNLILLTPNGRFELNKKICLSISGYHPETWLPSWSIRTALLALIGFLPSTPGGALGSLDYPPKERNRLAKLSGDWKCKECGCLMKDVLLPITEDGQSKESEEAKQLAAKLKFQDESVVKKEITENGKAINNPEGTGQPTGSGNSERETPSEPSQSAQTLTENSVGSPQNANHTTSEVESPVGPQVPAPIPEHFHQPARRIESSTFDYYLLIKIPLALLCIAIFLTLGARRLLVENGNPRNGEPEL